MDKLVAFLLLVVFSFMLTTFGIMAVWSLVVPDVFAGMVSQGLIPQYLSVEQALKLAFGLMLAYLFVLRSNES